jgi:hypothetical protein
MLAFLVIAVVRKHVLGMIPKCIKVATHHFGDRKLFGLSQGPVFPLVRVQQLNCTLHRNRLL